MKNFITFEGGEGCGKSTLVASLNGYCNNHNLPHIVTREPGGIKECEEIRNLLLSSKELSSKSQVLLFSASRSHLVDKVIRPALEENKIVFCDRFYDSTRIYQGYCGNLSDEEILKITDFAVEDVKPQLTFYLDIDPVIAFERKNGATIGDVFEEKDMSFHQKIREGFKLLAKNEPDRIKIIDASKSKEEVFDEVLGILKKEKVIND